jgi:hypothetical protein
MKPLIALLLSVLVVGCSRADEFFHPQAHHLIQHAGWFDGDEVSVCGAVLSGGNSCTLEVCTDGTSGCKQPVSVWISTSDNSCYSGDTQVLRPALVSGRFLKTLPSKGESGHWYTLARAKVEFVAACPQGSVGSRRLTIRSSGQINRFAIDAAA